MTDIQGYNHQVDEFIKVSPMRHVEHEPGRQSKQHRAVIVVSYILRNTMQTRMVPVAFLQTGPDIRSSLLYPLFSSCLVSSLARRHPLWVDM